MNNQSQDGRPKHLYTLDILRGLASLAIVLWHYQHFFFVAPGELRHDFIPSLQPLYFVFWPFYLYGYKAVQLFFVLSGFVFYFVYCDIIAAGRLSAFKFVVLRLSRLYPLYFVTLIGVAMMQFAAYHSTGKFIVYPFNDLYHFVLNSGFASHWGLERGFSFNAPTWSVSVEVVLYAAFFVLASIVGRSLVAALSIALAGACLAPQAHDSLRDIGQGFYCFFVGGSSFIIWDRLRLNSRWLTLSISLGALALSAIGCYELGHTRFSNLVLLGGCYPAVVLILASLQNFRHNLGYSCRIIGDITYSTYLLHFPLQLAIIYVSSMFALSIPYHSPFALVLFLVTLLTLSVPTYYLFERPAQSFFRKLLLSRTLGRVPAIQDPPLARSPRGPV